MENWDQKQLETVVQKRHGPGIKTTTEIVCKYFLEAIEQRKYGWFWQCPNGGDLCKYRHALPPGFILPSQITSSSKDDIPEEEQISLEEFLEQEVAYRFLFVRDINLGINALQSQMNHLSSGKKIGSLNS